MATSLYHLVPVEKWQQCKSTGAPYNPPTYQQDGFIHLTADPSLLLTVANHFYKSETGDWVVLKLDPSKLKSEVRKQNCIPAHRLLGILRVF